MNTNHFTVHDPWPAFQNDLIALTKLGEQHTNFSLSDIKCHLFLLTARSEYFRSLAESGMLEMQKYQSTVVEECPDVGLFIKFLVYGAPAFRQVNPSPEEWLAWCSLDEFYLLGGALKQEVKRAMEEKLDRHNVLECLRVAHQTQADALIRLCLDFLSDNFDLLANNVNLWDLDRELLIIIVQHRAAADR